MDVVIVLFFIVLFHIKLTAVWGSWCSDKYKFDRER